MLDLRAAFVGHLDPLKTSFQINLTVSHSAFAMAPKDHSHVFPAWTPELAWMVQSYRVPQLTDALSPRYTESRMPRFQSDDNTIDDRVALAMFFRRAALCDL